MLSSLGLGFVNYTTSTMVSDLRDADCDKRQRKSFQRLDIIPEGLRKVTGKFLKVLQTIIENSCLKFLKLMNHQLLQKFANVNTN